MTTDPSANPGKRKANKPTPSHPLDKPDPEDEERLKGATKSFIRGWNKAKRGIGRM